MFFRFYQISFFIFNQMYSEKIDSLEKMLSEVIEEYVRKDGIEESVNFNNEEDIIEINEIGVHHLKFYYYCKIDGNLYFSNYHTCLRIPESVEIIETFYNEEEEKFDYGEHRYWDLMTTKGKIVRLDKRDIEMFYGEN